MRKFLRRTLQFTAGSVLLSSLYLGFRAHEMYPYLKADVDSELERVATVDPPKPKGGLVTLEEHVKTARDLVLYAYNKPSDNRPLYHLKVDKSTNTMEVYDGEGNLVRQMQVGTAKELKETKTQFGEYVTPNGNYLVINHFNEQELEKKFGANAFFHYGTGMLQLSGPWTPHIAIHGVSSPKKVGIYDSNGCVRVENEDVEWLKKNVGVGSTVHIFMSKPQE